MKPRFLQVHWLRRARSFAAAGTGLVAAGTERGHCGHGGRAGGSRAPAGRGRPAAVSPTPGPEWARPRLPGGASLFQPFSCPLPVQKQPPRPPAGLQGAAAPGRRVGWAAAVQGFLVRAPSPHFLCPRGRAKGTYRGAPPHLRTERSPSICARQSPPPSCPAARVQVRRLGGVSLQVRGCPGHPRAHVDTHARRGVCVCWRPGHTRVWGFTRVRPLIDYGHRPTSASPPIRAGVKSERESGRPGVHASLGLRPCLCRHKRVCTRVRGACGHVRVHVLSGRV